MHRSFIISEEERKRILGIHENATKSQYLKIISEAKVEAPSDDTTEADRRNDFSKCPCVTRQGWGRGVQSSGLVYYQDSDGNQYFYNKKEGYCQKYTKTTKKFEVYQCEYTAADTPDDETLKSDASGKFKKCSCVTRMKLKRGIDDRENPFYESKDGKIRYYGFGDRCQKWKVDEDGSESKIGEFTCPSRVEAKSTSEIATGKAILSKGNKNNVVTVLNNALIKVGKLSSDKADSDVFDDKTKQAVIAFQQENVDSEGKKLKPDGVVGKRTWWALENTGAASSGVSDIAVEKSAQRVFGKELENIKKTSPLFTQDFSKSNAEKMANIKGDTTNQETKQQDGVAKGEQPIAKTPTTSADMQEFR